MSRSALTCLTLILGLLVCGTFDARSGAQQIGRAPVEVRVPRLPTPFIALGRSHLVYELHLTNFGTSPATLQQIDVLDGERRAVASWSGRQLWQRIRIVGQSEGGLATTEVVQPGMRAVAYLWISLQTGTSTPNVLMHRLTLADPGGERETITTMALPLAPAAATIASPVRGGPWVAIRGAWATPALPRRRRRRAAGWRGTAVHSSIFELVGRIRSLTDLLGGNAWRSDAGQQARTVTAEMPLENMVVRFKD